MVRKIHTSRYYECIHIKLSALDFLQLSSPPGKGKIKPMPSPTPSSKAKKGRLPSVSDDDNNPFEDKEEV